MGKQRYEMWDWGDGPNGQKNHQIVPAGSLPPEIQKLGKKIPMSPEMEEEWAPYMEWIEEEEKRKPGK
jgi:hypothetical protein